jgi:eukaryotic-like serine/threonine-protein kinase
MPAFQVTVKPDQLDGTRGAPQTIKVTATNLLDRPVTARAVAVVNPLSAAAWFTAPPQAQLLFDKLNASRDFLFSFEVPATAKAGSFTVRFDVYDVDNQDDNFGQSPALAFQVPEAPVVVPLPPKPFPWWILAAAAVLLLGVGFAVWKIFFSAKGMPNLEKKPYAEALGQLDAARFVITRVDTLNSDTTTYERGVVISQSIAPKTKLKADSNQLRLVVQQNYAAVPDLVGKTPLDAVKALADNNLDYEEHFDYRSEHTPEEGKVVSSNPGKDSLVVADTKVSFSVRAYTEPCRDPRICAFMENPGNLRVEYNRYRRRPP